MALPQHVSRRGRQLYYRRAFPKDLWPITGKAPFALSLHTDSLSEAQRSRPEAERRYWAAVDRARVELASRAARAPLTKAAAETLAVQWFLEALERAEDYRTPLSPEAVGKAIEDAEWAAAEARRALAEGELQDRERLARCLREQAGYASEPLADAALARLLGRAAVAAEEVERGRIVGDYGRRPKDALFAAAMEAQAPAPQSTPSEPNGKPQRTVTDLIAAFKADRWPKLSPSSQRAYGPVFRIVRAVLGADTPVAGIERDDGRRLFEAVQRLPANMSKLATLKGLPPLEAIAEGERLGLPPIAPKTVNDSYLGHIKSLFRWAVNEQWIGASPVTGLSVDDPTADEDRRPPFGDDLKRLFEGGPWQPRDLTGGWRPILYWGPLLGLFMGLRLGEIAALRVADIGEDRGFPTLAVRRGKTANARRLLVVHPELVRLGFLAMVGARRDAGAAQLFEGEAADTKGNWGRKLGEQFKRLVAERGLAGRKLTFHSLRHDFEDALREAGLHGTALGAFLAGRSQAGKVEAAYGAGYSTGAKAEAIAKVSYPVLSLSN